MALIAHGSTENALRRAQMPQPQYGAWAGRRVSRGFAVLVPERPGHAGDFPGQVCAPRMPKSAAAEFGGRANVPVTWRVADNSYFSPDFSRPLAEAFRGGGDRVDFLVPASSGSEGRWLVENDVGIEIAASEMDRALKAAKPR